LLEDKLRILAVSSNDERERILWEHLAEQHEDTPPPGNEDEEVISQVSIDEDGRVNTFYSISILIIISPLFVTLYSRFFILLSVHIRTPCLLLPYCAVT
jgi:hypothetical protein